MDYNKRKAYETPSVTELGELRNITRSGESSNSDGGDFNNNPSNADNQLMS